VELLTHWRPAEAAHTERAGRLSAGRRERAARGGRDPVEDFLWDYYALRPRDLVRWHPGVGVALADDGALGWRAQARWVARVDGGVTLDVSAFMADRGDGVAWIHGLLTAGADRPPFLACFGWHEWAMVHRQEVHRHPLPLRLGQAGTDAVVESAQIRCSHYDAFRFFTPAAAPLNQLQPTRATQPALEQPGCLHANMDLLKYAHKLGPACPGSLVLDAFELALQIRRLDMAASPYDCRGHGLEPVPVETAAGRAAYAAAQRGFALRAAALRRRLLAVTTALGAGLRPGAPSSPGSGCP